MVFRDVGLGRSRRERALALFDRNRAIGDDFPVPHLNDSPRLNRDFVLVRDDDDRDALCVQIVKDLHDLIAGFAVEISSRLVRQQ